MSHIIEKLNQNRLFSHLLIGIIVLMAVMLIYYAIASPYSVLLPRGVKIILVIAVLTVMCNFFDDYIHSKLIGSLLAWVVVFTIIASICYLLSGYYDKSLSKEVLLISTNGLLCVLAVAFLLVAFFRNSNNFILKIIILGVFSLIATIVYYVVVQYYSEREMVYFELLTVANMVFFLSSSLFAPQIIDKFSSLLGNATAWLVLLMVLGTLYNVVARYFYEEFSIPLGEIVMIMNSMVFLLSIPLLLQLDQHVRVDVFYSQISVRKQAFVDFCGTLFLLLPLCSIIIYYSWGYVSRSWSINESSSQTGGLPMLYLVKSLIIVVAVMLILQGVSLLVHKWQLMRNPKIAHPEHHHEDVHL